MSEIHKLKVSADTRNLNTIADFIEEKLKDNKINPDVVEEVLVAADEAATNVIKHSYKNKPGGYIKILLKLNSGEIVVSLFDKGIVFNPDRIPVPELSRDIKNRQVGGLGVFLMKKFMDEVVYYFKGIKGRNENEVRMIKYIGKID